MRTNLIKATSALFVILFSACALAHAGHDHSHWTSDIMHALFYASLAGCAAAVGFAAFKHFNKKQRISK